MKFKGLSNQEVKQSKEKFGKNIAFEVKVSPFWVILKGVVTEPLFIILVFTTLIYFFLGEYSEGIIMILALFFISAISLFQENRSRNAVESLKKLSSPQIKTIRNGIISKIPISEIVMDDVIVVEDGDIVPVDAFILQANDFSVNESILTGESLPVSKNEKSEENSVFQGSTVMAGSCIARVNAIGNQTKLGKIGQTLQEIEISKTPLQLQIKSFIRSMVIFGLIAFALVWGFNFYILKDFFQSLLQGLTLAMSVLPEEIPVAFSTFMALGAYHLYKKKVIARSPTTVETLGAATVICIDKTGTITENKMQISGIYDFTSDKTFDYTKEAFDLNSVLEYAMWSSETEPFDQMEKSLHSIYASVAPTDRRKEFTMAHEYPLSGTPPIMTHVFSSKKSVHIIAVKGSVEGVLNQSKLSKEQKQSVQEKTKEFAQKGYRVLAVGKADNDINNLPDNQFEFEFEFLGLIAFYDPPKKNMSGILKTFYTAGIQVKIITGDHPETALSIARQINFKVGSSRLLTGKDVMDISIDQLAKEVKDVNIFARMFPEAKLKIIASLKANGEVVAMTGDGVNDAPALKAAHIGIAMGMRGSEVAKNTASLILMDDDLFHMTEAVALGRRIYENLKKAIRYIISIHIPIILIVTLPLLLFWEFTSIFTPVHVIFLELIMGPTCSLVFENEPLESNSMEKAPRKSSVTFFSFRELSLSIIQGLVITFVCLGTGYYFLQNAYSEETVRTIIYTTLIFSNIFLTLTNRSFRLSIFTTIRYKNKLVPMVIVLALLVLFLSIYMPAIQSIFNFVRIDIRSILFCLIAAFTGVMWVEVYKLIRRRADVRREGIQVTTN